MVEKEHPVKDRSINKMKYHKSHMAEGHLIIQEMLIIFCKK